MKQLNLVSFLMMMAVLSCGQDKNVVEIQSFDISTDDRHIVLSCSYRGNTLLYKYDLEMKKVSILTTNKNFSYSYPVFFNENNRIIFVRFDSKFESTLCISNSDGSGARQLLRSNGLIKEIIVAGDNKSVYYTQASDYAKYSPLGISDSHGFDLYSYTLLAKETKKMTKLNSYRIDGLTQIGTDTLLFRNEGIDNGILVFDISKNTIVGGVVPRNNPRHDSALYYSPRFSLAHQKLFLTAPYELYMMHLDNLQANRITKLNYDIYQYRVFSTEESIAYIPSNDRSKIIIIDFQGKEQDIIDLSEVINENMQLNPPNHSRTSN